MPSGTDPADAPDGDTADSRRVVFAGTGESWLTLQERFEQRGEPLEVVPVEDCQEARHEVRATGAACIVTTDPDSCCRDTLGEAPTPVVLFTNRDLEGRPEEFDDLADTVVERGTEHSVDFLAEKIRSIANYQDESREEASRPALELTERVGSDSLTVFLLDGEGRVQWSNRAFDDVFPGGGTTAGDDQLSFTERLASLAASDEPENTALPSSPGSGQLLAVATPDRVRYYRRFSFPLADGEGTVGGVDRVEAIQDVTGVAAQFDRLRLFEVLAEEARDGLAVIDANGYLEYVNQSLADMLGYDQETLLGAHASLPMAEGELTRGQQYVQQLLDDEERDSIKYELTYLTADGQEREVGFHTTLRSNGDEYTGLISVMRDVTERKRREKRLEQFASVLSHDLRNPLSVAQGRATLLAEDADLSPEAEVHLEKIATQLDRMEGLIDDVLALAQDGTETSETTAVDLAAVVEDAWRNVDTADATLVCETDDRILADRGRLLQILENLFRNAVEHGGDDVRVAVGSLAEGGTNGFYVADDGPGIAAADRDEVFERGVTTSQQGTGFGLSIVQQLAEAHDWTVALTESERGGTRFEFRGVAESA